MNRQAITQASGGMEQNDVQRFSKTVKSPETKNRAGCR